MFEKRLLDIKLSNINYLSEVETYLTIYEFGRVKSKREKGDFYEISRCILFR